MGQFIAGFVIAILIAVPAVLFFARERFMGMRAAENGQRDRQLEELGKLTGGLAHEIKNPLSTVKINLKLIGEDLEDLNADRFGKSGEAESKQKFTRALRKIAVVQKETDRLGQILDGFLRYVDRAELQVADVDVNLLVGDMTDFYSPQAHSNSITIRQSLHETPLVCKADADMLKQAILNLFINASQAMIDGGELMIGTERQGANAIVRISDTGSGIAPDKLANIFDAYYSSRPHGSGLGLPTVRKIVEAHYGSITVDSEPGKGTSFTIILPLMQE